MDVLGIEYYVINCDIYFVVKEKILEGVMICGLCLCLCCGILYFFVEDINVIKIVLGYYCDDMVEILFLNMFYGFWLFLMLLKLLLDDGWNIVICLLVYCCEKDIEKFVVFKEFFIIFCNFCGL